MSCFTKIKNFICKVFECIRQSIRRIDEYFNGRVKKDDISGPDDVVEAKNARERDEKEVEYRENKDDIKIEETCDEKHVAKDVEARDEKHDTKGGDTREPKDVAIDIKENNECSEEAFEFVEMEDNNTSYYL